MGQEGFEVQALQKMPDQGRSANFQRIEGRGIEGGWHEILTARVSSVRAVMAGGRKGGKDFREAKKFWLGWRAARVSLARIFLLVKGCRQQRKKRYGRRPVAEHGAAAWRYPGAKPLRPTRKIDQQA